MFRSTFITILAVSAALVGATREPGACYQDNCQRAVQRMWQGTDVYNLHIAQCSSALACSYTPSASTKTEVATVTSGTITVTVAKSTVTAAPVAAGLSCPTGVIPSDQSAQCEGSWVSYSSACSCASVTGVTASAPTPTVTATVTTFVPASVVYV
ncbi:hypothetical protein IAT40_002841 [Kwoniella sp. CBS 6097]